MKQEKKIDDFIKKGLEVENTSLDFSNKIMHQINALDLEKEKALTSIIQKHILEEPSLNFTANVLADIHLSSKKLVYQPVISKKVWYVIFSIVILVISYVIFYTDGASSQSNIINVNLIKLANMFSFDIPKLSVTPLFTLSLFALTSLLFLDYFLQKRKISS